MRLRGSQAATLQQEPHLEHSFTRLYKSLKQLTLVSDKIARSTLVSILRALMSISSPYISDTNFSTSSLTVSETDVA